MQLVESVVKSSHPPDFSKEQLSMNNRFQWAEGDGSCELFCRDEQDSLPPNMVGVGTGAAQVHFRIPLLTFEVWDLLWWPLECRCFNIAQTLGFAVICL